MDRVMQIGLSNAATAAVLAILAAIATRLWRNPHFGYALWLIVLVRLVAPPLVPVPISLPAWVRISALDSTPVVATTNGPTVIERPAPARVPQERISRAPESKLLAATKPVPNKPPQVGNFDRTTLTMAPETSTFNRPSVHQMVAAVWLLGTFCYLLLVGVRAGEFLRAVRRSRRDVPEPLRTEVATVAARIGLRRPPRLLLVEAALPPMVWPGWRPIVLLPQRLVESLGASARQLLLIHELTHLRRRDHLLRWFEIGVVALYWWNPIAWWAVHRLQQSEEECCDAAVLSFQPDQATDYGRVLLAVGEFLSTGGLAAPDLSIGAARQNQLKRRLTMILDGPRWSTLSRSRLVGVALLGAAAIAVSWSIAMAQNESTPTTKPAPAKTTADKLRPKGLPAVKLASPTIEPRDNENLKALLTFEPLKAAPQDDELKNLLTQRYNAAVRTLNLYQYQYDVGTTTMSFVSSAGRTVAEAALALVDDPRTKIRILERYLEFAKRAEKQANDKLVVGGVTGFSPVDDAQAREARFDAEIRLHQLRAALSGKAPVTAPVTAERQPVALVEGQSHVQPQTSASGSPSWPPKLLTAKPLAVAPGDNELEKLLKEKYNAALRPISLYESQIQMGTLPPLDELLRAGRNFRDAQLALSQNAQESLQVLQEYLDFTKYLDGLGESFRIVGGVVGHSPVEAAQMHEARLDAEVALLRQRAAAASKPSGAAVAGESAQGVAPERGTDETWSPIKEDRATEALPRLLTAEPLKAAPGDNELQKLLKERHNAALRSLKATYNRCKIDPGIPWTNIVVAARKLLAADLALAKGQDLVRVYENYFEFMKFIERQTESMRKAKIVGPDQSEEVREALFDAEIKLLEAKRGK
jgi:beta-lactamase regulating signal transducer with metallopeptidase domain